MGRNTEKNVYSMVRLPKGEVHDFYAAEAASLDVPLSLHLTLLLIDRMKGMKGQGQQLWFPREAPVPQQSILAPLGENEEMDRITETLKLRTMAAASAWRDEE